MYVCVHMYLLMKKVLSSKILPILQMIIALKYMTLSLSGMYKQYLLTSNIYCTLFLLHFLVKI